MKMTWHGQNQGVMDGEGYKMDLSHYNKFMVWCQCDSSGGKINLQLTF